MAAVVCQRADVCVLLLISVISADTSGDAIAFVSRAERWNVGLLVMAELFIRTTGLLLLYVVGVNECLRGWWAECREHYTDVGEWKWSMLSLQTFLYQQKCYKKKNKKKNLGLDPAPPFSSQNILRNKTFSPCSDVFWWIDLRCYGIIAACHDDACFGRIDHLETLWLRQFVADSWQQHVSRDLPHGECSREGESVTAFEMDFWLCSCFVVCFLLLARLLLTRL